MTPRNKIKKRNATDEATSQVTMMMPAVIAIENQATQDFHAQNKMRSMKKARISEATFDAFVLKPWGFVTSIHWKTRSMSTNTSDQTGADEA